MGRHTGILFEDSCEIAVILESDFSRNLRQRIASVPDDGIADTVFVHILQERHSEILFEYLAKITFVIAKVGCDLFRGQIGTEILLYIQLYRMHKAFDGNGRCAYPL